jgi:hypothetical protein
MRDLVIALPFIFAWCLFLEYVVRPVIEAVTDGVSELRFRRLVKRRRARACELGIDPNSLLATFL